MIEPHLISLTRDGAVMLRIVLPSVALLSSAALAAPSVFIPAGSPAWWSADNAQGRVIGTTAGGVTVAQLSKFIEAAEIFSPYKVCSLTL